MVEKKDGRKRQMSEEQKQRMREGRARKRAEMEAQAKLEAQQALTDVLNNEVSGEISITETQQPREIAEDKANPRPNRVSLAESRNIMNVEHIPDGYIGRWTNDVKNRIQERLDRGYVFAFDDPNGRRIALEVGDTRVEAQKRPGTVVSKTVEMTKEGPLIAYLMLQRKEWYDEDQNFKESEIRRTEEEQADKIEAEGLYI